MNNLLNLALSPEAIYEQGRVYIPVPIAEIVGRVAVSLSQLVNWALGNIPKDFASERQKIANSLDAMERQNSGELRVLGPDEGDFYIELPNA